MGHKLKKELVCLCNQVPRDIIENAIRAGADTPNKIFDRTCAGIGACGGTCRVKLYQLLEAYQDTNKFPEKLSLNFKPKRLR